MEDRKTILVVEDELSLQKAVDLKLRKSNFDVLTARSAEEAVEHMDDNKVDAIWLDHYLLGKENGLDFLIKVKGKSSKWGEVPVFVVSNTASEDKVQKYLQYGAEKFYVKSEYRLDQIIGDIKTMI